MRPLLSIGFLLLSLFIFEHAAAQSRRNNNINNTITTSGEAASGRAPASSDFGSNLGSDVEKCLSDNHSSLCFTQPLPVSNVQVDCGPGNISLGQQCVNTEYFCQTCAPGDLRSACAQYCPQSGGGNRGKNAYTCTTPDDIVTPTGCVSKSTYCNTCSGAECTRICSSSAGDRESASKSAPADQDPYDNSSELLSACKDAVADIQSSCNPEAKGWMQEMEGVIQAIGPAFQAQQNTCGTLASVDAATKGSIATFAVMCNNSYNECKKACSLSAGNGNHFFSFGSTVTETQMKANLKICEDMGRSGRDAQQRAMQATQQITAAIQACRQAMGGDVDVRQHCAKPENMNTPDCQINLGTQMQVATTSASSSAAGAGMNHQGVGSDMASGTGAGNGYGMEPIDESADRTVTPHASKQGEDIGGAKGGGRVAGGDGSGGGGSGGSGRGSGGGGLFSNILSGFFGGGGGSGGSRGGGLRGLFGGGSGSGGGSQAAGTNNKMPDLRQFMPGGLKDPNRNRGVAGQWVGRDGMSGPHANIWKMINNRYQYKRATLLP